MPFAVGDEVHIPGFGTGVIREIRSGGRYVVMVKNTTMVVGEAQLTAVEPRKRPRADRAARSNAELQATSDPATRAQEPSTIDLHGRTALEAEAAIDDFLNAAILAGLSEVRIIHGRSGGRVKSVLHARLRQLSAVRAFRLDPKNPGVTIVDL